MSNIDEEKRLQTANNWYRERNSMLREELREVREVNKRLRRRLRQMDKLLFWGIVLSIVIWAAAIYVIAGGNNAF